MSPALITSRESDTDSILVNYHLYTDKATNVTYCATLVRPTALANQREKYLLKVGLHTYSHNPLIYPNTLRWTCTQTFNSHLYKTQSRHPGRCTNVPIDNPHAQLLQVYESNGEPRVYAAYVKYSRVGKATTHLLAPLGSSLDLAMKSFKEFFRLRTGRGWDQRFDETPVPPMKDVEGNTLPAHEGWYQHENQMGLLASFLRNGPGETAGGDERDPDSLVTDSNERHEGAPEQQEDKRSESEDEAGHSDGERAHSDSGRMSMEPDGGQEDDGMVESKKLATGVSTEAAILIF